MMVTALYCAVDDFMKKFDLQWKKTLLTNTSNRRGPDCSMSDAEMMTIVILFHQSNYRTFKLFYQQYVPSLLSKEFPKRVSYSRFVFLMKGLFVPLFAFLHHHRGAVTGISYIDSTKIQVCHNKRISRNKVFKNLAKRGKTTAGWFFGFKLHLIVNDRGEILAFQLSQGNVSDVSMLELLSKDISGKLYGDKGYISSEIAKKLLDKGVELFTSLRENMKNKLMHIVDKVYLRKRSIIETINDQLKNISQIEHTRHRSPANFLINLLSGLIAYQFKEKKPSINLDCLEKTMLKVA